MSLSPFWSLNALFYIAFFTISKADYLRNGSSGQKKNDIFGILTSRAFRIYGHYLFLSGGEVYGTGPKKIKHLTNHFCLILTLNDIAFFSKHILCQFVHIKSIFVSTKFNFDGSFSYIAFELTRSLVNAKS